MTSTNLKARLALLKDVATDALSALDEYEARTNFDLAQQREATFRFVFPGKVSITGLRTLLSAISKRHNIDPGYVMASQSDHSALIEETAGDADAYRYGVNILCISNDHTGGSCRVIASPDVEVGEVVFGALYLTIGASAANTEAPTLEQPHLP